VIASILVAGFTGLLAWATYRQVRLTRTLAETSTTATKAAHKNTALTARLAEATEIAANAARDSAAAMPTLERAYLFVETAPLDENDLRLRPRLIRTYGHENTPPNAATTVRYQIVNHGKTPAISKAMSFRLQYRADTDGPALQAVSPNPIGEIVVSGGAIYPSPEILPYDAKVESPKLYSHKLAVQLAQTLRTEEVERMGRGLFYLVFLGRIVYDDVFGQEHETRVCWRYDTESHQLISYGGSDYNLRT
jgi:hypothetical protein